MKSESFIRNFTINLSKTIYRNVNKTKEKFLKMSDWGSYLLYSNPISKGVGSALYMAAKPFSGKSSSPTTIIQRIDCEPLWKLTGSSRMWIRLAGVSGAVAVGLGAWGAHRIFEAPTEDARRDSKAVFETANRYHFFHTLALLTVPLSRRPMITGTMMFIGTSLFCGTLYYKTITGDSRFNRLAPIGGMTLILAWVTFIL